MFWKRRIYLDYAAGVSGNPSSPHEEGRRAKKMLEDARTSIARLVEVQPGDVIFTSGATESNALAILGHIRALRRVGRKDIHILYLPSAHASIIGNANMLSAEGVNVGILPVKNYRVDIEALKKMLTRETVLVSVEAVCGETGVIWNTREVRHILDTAQLTFKSQILLHVDASQAPLTEKITRAHFAADMMTLDASKISTVRGIGVLIAHRTIPIIPLYAGGGQERGLRSGSEAPELARSFAMALAAAARAHETFRASAERNRTNLIRMIASNVPNVQVHEGRVQAPHILNLSLPNRDTDYLVALLDEAGFAVSSRSACETDSEAGSRAVFVLTGDLERARTTLRISWGPGISPRAFTRFTRALVKAVAFIDSSG